MTSKERRHIFAVNLRREMDRAGISRQQLCAMTDIKYTALCEWLNEHRYPRRDTIDKLAYFFSIAAVDLTEEATPEKAMTDFISRIIEDLDAEKRARLVAFARQLAAEQEDGEKK